MRIPLPCRLGDKAECNGKTRILEEVSWFNWASTRGMEYTYFFRKEENKWNKWEYSDFYCSTDAEQPDCLECVDIPDALLEDIFIKDRGYPLKGRGYVDGIGFVNDKLYVDFLLTDHYFAHVYCECNEDFSYKPDGDIIFPTGWDVEHKNRILLKNYQIVENVEEK